MTRDEVTVIHATIKLRADPYVMFDNPVTLQRERWEHGVLAMTWEQDELRTLTWIVTPNPWVGSTTDLSVLPAPGFEPIDEQHTP
jgi:hypothetical protein